MFPPRISSLICLFDYLKQGVRSAENYETFIRRLTYLIGNVNEMDPDRLDLIKSKQFYVTCFRSEPNIETNTIMVQINLTKSADENKDGSSLNVANENGGEGGAFVAHKQAQRLVVAESEDDITRTGLNTAKLSNKSLSKL